MKKTVTQWEFEDAFKKSDTYKDNFTHSALKALYEYLCEYEEGTGEELELDMIALCCEYSEYASAWEAMQAYRPDDMPTVDDTMIVDEGDHGMDLVEIEEAQEALALEWLEERTQVIPFDGTIVLTDGTVIGDKGVIIQQF